MKKRKGAKSTESDNKNLAVDGRSKRPPQRSKLRPRWWWLFCVAALGLPAVVFWDAALFSLDRLGLTDPASALIREVRRDTGAVVKLAMGQNSNGVRALFASERLPKGTALVEMSALRMLTQKTLAPHVKALADTCLRAPSPCNSFAVLALGLLAEKRRGSASPFSTYIRSLPPQISNLLSFGKLQIEMNDAKRGYETLNAFVLEIEALAAVNPQAVVPPPTHEEARWAVAAVLTRSFYMPGEDDLQIRMVPILDLANHHPDSTLKSFDLGRSGPTESRVLLAMTRHVIHQGEEVHNHYGRFNNVYLLLNYGFSHPGNMWGPKVHLNTQLSAVVIAMLKRYDCKPDDWKGDNNPRVFVQLRLDAPRDSEGGFVLPVAELRCARVAQLLSNNADAATSLLDTVSKMGYFDAPVGELPFKDNPDLQSVLDMNDSMMIMMVLQRCTAMSKNHEVDVESGWLARLEAHAERGVDDADGEAWVSRALAEAFKGGWAAVAGCARAAKVGMDKLGLNDHVAAATQTAASQAAGTQLGEKEGDIGAA